MSYILMTKIFDFQAKTVDEVVDKIVKTLLSGNKIPRQFVIAPTGSGKTVMAAASIERLVQREIIAKLGKKVRVIFVTHSKTMAEDFSEKFKIMNTSVSNIDDIENKVYTQTPVLLSNPEKFSAAAKQGKDFLEKWLGPKDKEFRVLVMDEGDVTHDGKRNQIIQDIVDPDFEICFSATFDPNKDARRAERNNRDKSEVLHKVDIEEVIASGLIVKSHEYLVNTHNITFESLMKLVEDKRRELESIVKRFLPPQEQFVPKVLIVEQSSEVNDRLEDLGAFLPKEYGVKLTPEMYCIITQEIDEQGLKEKDKILYYIGDQLVGRGWDSPQCYIVVSFKNSTDVTVGIQLLGRVSRMPFQKHFDSSLDALNKGYVYVNGDHSVVEAVKFYLNDTTKELNEKPKIKVVKLSKIKENINQPNFVSYIKEERTPASNELLEKVVNYLKKQYNAVKGRLVSERKVERKEVDSLTGHVTSLGSEVVEIEISAALTHLRKTLVAKGLPQDLANDAISEFTQDDECRAEWKHLHQAIAGEITNDESADFIELLGEIDFATQDFKFTDKSVDEKCNKTWSRSLYQFEDMGDEESSFADTLDQYCLTHDLYWTKNVENKQIRLSLGYYPDFIIFNEKGYKAIEYKGPHLMGNPDTNAKIKFGEQSNPQVIMVWTKGGELYVRDSKGQDILLANLSSFFDIK